MYKAYRSYGQDGWGPFIHYDEPGRYDKYLDEIDKLLRGTPKQVGDGAELEMPSAWHAALFFLRLESFYKYSPIPQHQLYRGQPNSSWILQTTLDRIELDRQKPEVAATILATAYFSRRLYIPYLHLASYSALSRHMGFVSQQMDWTVDPAVAISFACQQSSNESQGKVFSLATSLACDKGLEVWCPIPGCDRLYNQLGVFVRSSKLSESLYKECPSVVFPKPECDIFEVVRDGENIDLMQVHPWYEQSASWIRKVACEHADDIYITDDIMQYVDEGIKSIEPAPDELLLKTPEDRLRWAEAILDLYHWLFIFMTRDGCGRTFNSRIAQNVVCANRLQTELVVEVLKLRKSISPDYEFHGMEKWLEELLSSIEPPCELENDYYGVVRNGEASS